MQHLTDIIKITPPVYYNRHIWSVLDADCSKYRVEWAKYRAGDAKYHADSSKYSADDAKYHDECSKYRVGDTKYRADSSKYRVDYAKYHDECSGYRAGGAKYNADSSKYGAHGLRALTGLPAFFAEFYCCIYDRFICAVYASLLNTAGALAPGYVSAASFVTKPPYI